MTTTRTPIGVSTQVPTAVKAGVMAALLATALMAYGMTVENNRVATVPQGRVIFDQAPTWQPNQTLLEAITSTYEAGTSDVVPDIEFGGMPAPSWAPNYDRLETDLYTQPTSGPR